MPLLYTITKPGCRSPGGALKVVRLQVRDVPHRERTGLFEHQESRDDVEPGQVGIGKERQRIVVGRPLILEFEPDVGLRAIVVVVDVFQNQSQVSASGVAPELEADTIVARVVERILADIDLDRA